MQDTQSRFGLAELATLLGFLIVAVIVGIAISKGWTIAIIPGITYVLATVAAYLMYRHQRAVSATAAQPQATVRGAEAAHVQMRPAAVAVQTAPLAFRVVDTRGVCPLGYKKGIVVTMTSGGSVHPPLCAAAETVLRLAAKEDPAKSSDWCCPVYEHLLVFRREAQAA